MAAVDSFERLADRRHTYKLKDRSVWSASVTAVAALDEASPTGASLHWRCVAMKEDWSSNLFEWIEEGDLESACAAMLKLIADDPPYNKSRGTGWQT